MLRLCRLRLSLAFFLVAVVFTACARGGTDEVEFSGPDREGNRDAEATIQASVAGAFEFDFQGDSVLRITEVIGKGIPKHKWFLQVGNVLPAFPTPELGFRFATQLVYEYEGDGRYTIKPNVTPDGQHTLTASDGVAEFTLPQDTANPVRRFDRVQEDCSLVLSNQANTGHLKCPRITDAEGTQEISLEVKWNAKPSSPTPATTANPSQ